MTTRVYVDRDNNRRPLEFPLGGSVRIATHYDGGALEFYADEHGNWSVRIGPAANEAGGYREIANGRLVQIVRA